MTELEASERSGIGVPQKHSPWKATRDFTVKSKPLSLAPAAIQWQILHRSNKGRAPRLSAATLEPYNPRLPTQPKSGLLRGRFPPPGSPTVPFPLLSRHIACLSPCLDPRCRFRSHPRRESSDASLPHLAPKACSRIAFHESRLHSES
jgi:hypothetical protein